MSFGIGLGDIVTVINLAGKLYNTIRDGPEVLDTVRSEVQSLQHSLRSLYDAIAPPGSLLVNASTEQKKAIWEVLQNCTRRLVKLEYPITWAQRSRDRSAIIQLWAKMRSYFADHQGSRNALATHTASLNIFLSSLNHLALKNMQYQLMDAITHPMPSSDRGVGAFASNTGGQGQDASFDAEWAALGQRLKRAGVRSSQLRRWQGDIHAFVVSFLRDAENVRDVHPEESALGRLAKDVQDSLEQARLLNKQRRARQRQEYRARIAVDDRSRKEKETRVSLDEENADDIMEIFKSGLSFDADEAAVMDTFPEDTYEPERTPSPSEVPTTGYQTDTRAPSNRLQPGRRKY